MPENKRVGRNIGRIELLAVQDKVKTMLEAGYDRKKIHDRLLTEGSITMSYPTFCYQLKQLISNSTSAASPNPAQWPKTVGKPKTDPSEPFSINRNPKLEDFV